MAVLSTLRDSLKRQARVQPSENFTDPDVEGFINAALREHNSNYTIGTLPAAEEELVLLLGWIRLCHSRAAQWAQAADTGGQARLGQDNDTPFKKNMSLAKSLKLRYDELRIGLGLESKSDVIEVSTSTAQDTWTEAEVPLALSRPLTAPVLSLAAGESLAEGTTYILKWTVERSENFQEWRLFHMATASNGAATIREEWNQFSAAKTPQISDAAALVKTISDQQILCLRVTGVDKSQRNLFLLVAVSRSGKYSYGNELELKQ